MWPPLPTSPLVPPSCLGLAAGLASSNLKQFDILAFDACLMGNFETVSALQQYTKALLASEHLEPGEGFDYRWVRCTRVWVLSPRPSAYALAC